MRKPQIRDVRVQTGGGANLRVALIPRRTDSRPGRRNAGRYDVMFEGGVIVANSADPECDLARALLARGIRGSVTVIDADTGRPRSQVNIQNTARVSVREDRHIGPRFDTWRPRPQTARESVEGSQRTGETKSPGAISAARIEARLPNASSDGGLASSLGKSTPMVQDSTDSAEPIRRDNILCELDLTHGRLP
jgi:hypothetical protein